MRILGIETSCDDTSVGIISQRRSRIIVETNLTASQVLIHRKYGGVVPEVAAREHAITILPTLKAALRAADKTWADIDAIAVTAGPGLNTALLVGVETARTLSWLLNKHLIRVNHIEGHICSNFVSTAYRKNLFPAVTLIVSGGHTELILVRDVGDYELLGRTLDDAAGEAFDKVAKLLGLDYPGGPEISRRAATGGSAVYTFPRALMRAGNLDFSYAGLKTSVLYKVRDMKKVTPKIIDDVCASFQTAAVEPLVKKTIWAVQKTGARTVFLGGGVAANKLLRQAMRRGLRRELPNVRYCEPALNLCADNGAMIAIAGLFHAQRRDFTPWQKIVADPNWELV